MLNADRIVTRAMLLEGMEHQFDPGSISSKPCEPSPFKDRPSGQPALIPHHAGRGASVIRAF